MTMTRYLLTVCLGSLLFSSVLNAQTPDACSPIKPKPKNSNVRVPDVGKPKTPASGVANGWVLLYENDSYQQISDEVFCRNNKIQFSSSNGEKNFNNNPNCNTTTCTKVVEQGTLTQVVLTGKNGNTNTFLWKGDFPFFNVLHTFAGPPNDGWAPNAPLIKDSAGNFYGTTSEGGSSTYTGTVFKVDPSGTLTVLYNFTGGADGGGPDFGLARDSSGNLYGTTIFGGDLNCVGGTGCGVVFKLDTSNVETVLHTFGWSDGAYPGGVVLDASGNLYGTTAGGGSYGSGTVFKMDTNNVETVLWSFSRGTDGVYPSAQSLLMDSSGNLYGTTQRGGSAGCGTVFKVDQSGNETTLFSFSGPPIDGCVPFGSVAMDSSGNLYGTTAHGGSNFGTVWELSGSNEFLMHTFTGGADGSEPGAGVVLDASGNVYGTTGLGGAFSYGALFQITPSGTETVLYDFSGSFDGAIPNALLLDSEGYLWGTATRGGSAGYGTLWGFDLN